MPGRRRGISYGVAFAAVAVALVALLPSAARAFPGEQVWVAEYEAGVSDGFDTADAVAVNGDGTRVYVTGESQSPANFGDYATVAYGAATGTQAWVARYDGGYEDAASSVAVSPDGSRVFVTGRSDRALASNADYATVAYDSAGNQLWARRSGGSGTDDARAIAVSPDGKRVFVTGTSEAQETSQDYLTIAYDAASGTRLWSRRYDGPASGGSDSDQAAGLALSSDGARLYVTGGSRNSALVSDYATIAYDTTSGATVWARRYDGPQSQADAATAISLNRAGTRVFVTGDSYNVIDTCIDCKSDYATVAYRADTGQTLWVRRFGQANTQDYGRAIGVSSKGFVVVTGYSKHHYGYDYATVAYGTGTGAYVWSKRYDFVGRNDVPYALGVSPDGARVYVTGESEGGQAFTDVATLAYDTATGARTWLTRYDAGGPEGAFALAVAPDGKHVFVAGRRVGDAGWEYLTVAYAG